MARSEPGEIGWVERRGERSHSSARATLFPAGGGYVAGLYWRLTCFPPPPPQRASQPYTNPLLCCAEVFGFGSRTSLCPSSGLSSSRRSRCRLNCGRHKG